MRAGVGELGAFLLLLVLISRPAAPRAATYYAQPSGLDHSCAQAQQADTPRASANAGTQCLSPGDTLTLLDGTYPECLSDVLPSGLGPNQHTTLKAAHRRMAVFTPPKACESPGVAILIGCCNGTHGTAKSFITLDGLKLQVDPTSIIGGVSAQGGADDTDGAHDLHFLALEFSGCVNTGSVSSFCVGAGQGGNGHDFLYRDNYFHDLGMVRQAGTSGQGQGCTTYGMYLSGWNNLIENNEFYRGCGYGIHAYSPSDHFYGNVIRNNYFHDMGAAAVMVCGNGGTHSPAPNYLYNNIFARVSVGLGIADQASGGQTGGITGGPSCSGVPPNNNYIYNNTLVQVNQGNPNAGTLLGCIQLGAAGGLYAGNNVVRNNICAATAASTEGILNDSPGAATNAIDHNLCGTAGSNCQFTGDPAFVTPIPTHDLGPAGGSGSIRPSDFQLQASSPALAKGADVSAVAATDIAGNVRPAPAGTLADLGAWEMGDAGGQGTPPGPEPGPEPEPEPEPTPTPAPVAHWPVVDCLGAGVGTSAPALALPRYTWALWLQPRTPPSETQIENVFSNGSEGGEAFGLAWGHSAPAARQAGYQRLANGGWSNVQMPGPALSAGVWRHFAATYDGLALTLYVQGMQVARQSGISLAAAQGRMTFCGQPGGTQVWHGQLDEVTLWDQALSAAQLAAFFTRTTRQHAPPWHR